MMTMYKEHVPQITAGMRADPEVFARGIMFAVCSIQQPIDRVPAMLRNISQFGGKSSALAMPMKYEAWEYLERYATRTWHDVIGMETRDALVRLLCVPSLGIVKAAFVLQFLGHDIGCLDTHNLRKLGLGLETFKHSNKNPRSPSGYTSNKIALYLSIAAGGGSNKVAREFWDSWCNARAPAYAMTGEQISALHLEIIA